MTRKWQKDYLLKILVGFLFSLEIGGVLIDRYRFENETRKCLCAVVLARGTWCGVAGRVMAGDGLTPALWGRERRGDGVYAKENPPGLLGRGGEGGEGCGARSSGARW